MGVSRSGRKIGRCSDTDRRALGERFFFDFVSAFGGETYWRVLDPYGAVVFDRNSFSADLGLKTLQNTGTYTVIIEGRINTVGNASYTFNAQKIVDEVIPLELGVSQGSRLAAGQLGGALYLDGLQTAEIAHSAAIDLTRVVTLDVDKAIVKSVGADQWFEHSCASCEGNPIPTDWLRAAHDWDQMVQRSKVI